MKLKVVIPSKGRAETIGEQALRLFPSAYVIVDERERDEYAAVVPSKQLLTHPGAPGLRSLAAIRNHILESVKADVLVQVDDDITALVSMPGWSKREITDPEAIEQLLEVTAQCALDAGCALFGFSPDPNQLHYKPQQPLTLSSWVGTVLGFVGKHGLRYDESLSLHDDVDLSLQSLLRDRIVWRDDRWAFVNHRVRNPGGLASYRSDERYSEQHEILKSKWGPYVGFRSTTSSSQRKAKGLTQGATLTTQVKVARRQNLLV
jgi:hypothetical protein